MKYLICTILFLVGLSSWGDDDKDSAITFDNQPLISCDAGAYRMYNSEILEADSLFRYSFNLYLNTWDEKKPSVYKSAKYPGQGTVKLLLFPDSGAFSMPCDNNLVTSHYGWRRGRMHRGTDIDLETGDAVRSVMDGVVRFAGWYSGYGYCVLIRHMNGLESLYAHLSKIQVQSGQVLNHGDQIGLGGTTGHSTGSHLHFELHFMGRAINPELVFDFKGKKAKTDYLIISSNGKAKAFDPETESDSEESTQSLADDHDAETEVAKPRPKPQVKYHYVRKGESLYRISKKYKTSVSALCKLNGIRSSSTLRIGQKLRVK